MFGIKIKQVQQGCDPVPRWVCYRTAGLHSAFWVTLADLGPVCDVTEKVILVPASKRG